MFTKSQRTGKTHKEHCGVAKVSCRNHSQPELGRQREACRVTGNVQKTPQRWDPDSLAGLRFPMRDNGLIFESVENNKSQT